MKKATKDSIKTTIMYWPAKRLVNIAYFIFLIDLGAYIVKYRPLHLTSTTEFLSLFYIPWADAPTFWVSAHNFLSAIPILFTLNVLAIVWLIVSVMIISYFDEPVNFE